MVDPGGNKRGWRKKTDLGEEAAFAQFLIFDPAGFCLCLLLFNMKNRGKLNLFVKACRDMSRDMINSI